MANVQRTARLGLRIAPEELEMVQALASHHGVSASDVVRVLIRRAFADLPKTDAPTNKRAPRAR